MSSFQKQLDAATSEVLLEPDLPKNLRCCDIIRAGDVGAKDALKAIRRKLHHKNPNAVLLALEVLEMVVKNCGADIQAEIATQSFMNEMRGLLKAESPKVRAKVLELIQVWAHAFKNQPAYDVVPTTYNILRAEGHRFPAFEEQSAAMFQVERPPEWKDGNACFHCRTKFTLTNRRHHCRNCGQIFCGSCSSKTSSIPRLGIEKLVRVCDPCHEKITRGDHSVPSNEEASTSGQDFQALSDYEQMRRLAMEFDKLSPEEQMRRLTQAEATSQPSAGTVQAGQPPDQKKREDELKEREELELALALSLSEAESQKEPPSVSRHYPVLPPDEPSNGSASAPSAPPPSQSRQSSLYSSLAPQHEDIHQEEEDHMAKYLRSSQSSRSRSRKPKSEETRRVATESGREAVRSQRSAVHQSHSEPSAAETDEEGMRTVEPADQVVQQYRTLISRFETKIARLLSRGGDPQRDASLQHLYQELTKLNPGMMTRMDDLEAERDQLLDTQVKYQEAKDARARFQQAREEHLARIDQQRREQELLERMQLEQKMKLLEQQERDRQEQARLQAERLRVEQQQKEEARRQAELQSQYHMQQLVYGQSAGPGPSGGAVSQNNAPSPQYAYQMRSSSAGPPPSHAGNYGPPSMSHTSQGMTQAQQMPAQSVPTTGDAYQAAVAHQMNEAMMSTSPAGASVRPPDGHRYHHVHSVSSTAGPPPKAYRSPAVSMTTNAPPGGPLPGSYSQTNGAPAPMLSHQGPSHVSQGHPQPMNMSSGPPPGQQYTMQQPPPFYQAGPPQNQYHQQHHHQAPAVEDKPLIDL